MGRTGKHVTWICALVLGGCTTASGEKPGFIQSMQQVVGAASMAVGLKAGDSGMAQKGADMFGQGLGAPANTTPGSTEPGTSPSSTTPRPVAQAGGGQDRQAVANACTSKAQSRYNRQAQNVLQQQAACIYHCAWQATSDPQYQRLYLQSQQNANSLCSANISQTCNNIDTGYCRP
jgi:hypothetical protein